MRERGGGEVDRQADREWRRKEEERVRRREGIEGSEAWRVGGREGGRGQGVRESGREAGMEGNGGPVGEEGREEGREEGEAGRQAGRERGREGERKEDRVAGSFSLNVLRHVFRHVFYALPALFCHLLTRNNAVWAAHSLCSRRMWPATFFLLVETMTVLTSHHACSHICCLLFSSPLHVSHDRVMR